jgi:hypothetical protein
MLDRPLQYQSYSMQQAIDVSILYFGGLKRYHRGSIEMLWLSVRAPVKS